LTASAYHPLDQDSPFERPPSPRGSSKAAARAARRADKQAKENQQAKPLVAKNENQQDYLDILRDGDSVIAIGPAGTGKTYLAARIAAQRLIKGDIDKIIVSGSPCPSASMASASCPATSTRR
jgi:phosphate starvation-inducible protein PhoH